MPPGQPRRFPAARRPRGADAPAAVWRDGVHLSGTPIWCDARRRRDVCFASAYGRVARVGHGQLIATPQTLAMIGATDQGHLAVPVRQRFSLGQLELELLPSGAGLGAAALRVAAAGRVTLYAGAVGTLSAGLLDAGEVRTADCAIVAAPYGAPEHDFPDPGAVTTALVTWIGERVARTSVLVLVSTELRALEVAILLARAGLGPAASPALRNLARRARNAAPQVPELRPLAKDRPVVAIATVEQRASVAARLGSAVETAWVSGEAHDPAAVTRACVDRAFAWSSCADRRHLLSWIEATGAREVYVTGRCAPEIAAALGERASVLGPPEQMPLFRG